MLYYNSVFFNNLYRVPVDAQGKAGAPVEIWMDAPVKGIDGIRIANGKMVQAENGSGKIHVLTINGDRAHVEVIKEGLSEPTGMEPGRGELWIANRAAGNIRSTCHPPAFAGSRASYGHLPQCERAVGGGLPGPSGNQAPGPARSPGLLGESGLRLAKIFSPRSQRFSASSVSSTRLSAALSS